MRRKLLVGDVKYAGLALPGENEVVMTVRRDAAGVTEWEATATVAGRIEVGAAGRFAGATPMGLVAGGAVATARYDGDATTGHTTITWHGDGPLSLPDDD